MPIHQHRGHDVHHVGVVVLRDEERLRVHGAYLFPVHGAIGKGKRSHAAGEVVEAIELFTVPKQIAEALLRGHTLLLACYGASQVGIGPRIEDVVADHFRFGVLPQGIAEHPVYPGGIRLLVHSQEHVEGIAHGHCRFHGRIAGGCFIPGKEQDIIRRSQGGRAQANQNEKQQKDSNTLEHTVSLLSYRTV